MDATGGGGIAHQEAEEVNRTAWGMIMSESRGPAVGTMVEEAPSRTGSGEHVAHLVLKADWPIALCGANVSEHLGVSAPALDRCTECLGIAAARGLGRPGWESRG